MAFAGEELNQDVAIRSENDLEKIDALGGIFGALDENGNKPTSLSSRKLASLLANELRREEAPPCVPVSVNNTSVVPFIGGRAVNF